MYCRRVCGPLLALAVLAPAAARGDARELYLTAAFAPTYGYYENPLVAQGTGRRAGYSGEAAAYWGLTNTWHIGGAIRLSRATNLRFSNVSLVDQDGTWRTGSLVADDTGLGASGLLLYRVNTHYNLAPVLSAEAGFIRHTYSRIVHVPTGASFGFSFGDRTETRFNARFGLALEYRLSTHFVAAGGVVYSIEPGGWAPRSISVPLRFGYIWP